MSPTKASEITACLVQGRQFFAAAGIAENLAQPLLLYYGVLALSRGLILFLDASLRLTSLAPSHGVEAKDWAQALLAYGEGAKNIPDLKVMISGSGTFGQLSSVTQNNERWRVFGIDYPFEIRGLTTGSISIRPTVLTVLNILGRIPDLRLLFEKTFRSKSRCHPSFIYVFDLNTFTHVEALETFSDSESAETDTGLLSSIQLTDLLTLPASAPTNVQPISEHGARFLQSQELYPYDVDVRWTSIPHASVDALLPHLSRVKNDRSGNIFLVAPLPDGIVLSSMSLLFLLSYVIGMLVRYYPSTWQALVARQSGDITYPLLRAAMVMIRDQFPTFVINELEDVHPRFPRVI